MWEARNRCQPVIMRTSPNRFDIDSYYHVLRDFVLGVNHRSRTTAFLLQGAGGFAAQVGMLTVLLYAEIREGVSVY